MINLIFLIIKTNLFQKVKLLDKYFRQKKGQLIAILFLHLDIILLYSFSFVIVSM